MQEMQERPFERRMSHWKKPSLQTSKLPSFRLPLHPRHVCDVPKATDAASRKH